MLTSRFLIRLQGRLALTNLKTFQTNYEQLKRQF
jgi:hypothetical protein